MTYKEDNLNFYKTFNKIEKPETINEIKFIEMNHDYIFIVNKFNEFYLQGIFNDFSSEESFVKITTPLYFTIKYIEAKGDNLFILTKDFLKIIIVYLLF